MLKESLQKKPNVQLMDLSKLVPNAENPKKPLGKKYKKGLEKSLSTFGFAGVILVSPNPDGTYFILDGNTRYEELKSRGESKAPVMVLDNVVTESDRKKFVMAYDRHKKQYDDNKVICDINALIAQGEDMDNLEILSGISDLEKILNAAQKDDNGLVEEVAEANESFILYGSSSQIQNIKTLLKSIKGKLKDIEKVQKMLQEFELLDITNETFLSILLNVCAHFSGKPYKIAFPIISLDQEKVIMNTLQEFAERNEITGDYAISRALEYMIVEKASEVKDNGKKSERAKGVQKRTKKRTTSNSNKRINKKNIQSDKNR